LGNWMHSKTFIWGGVLTCKNYLHLLDNFEFEFWIYATYIMYIYSLSLTWFVCIFL
jgi:hypothetical protein